MCVQNSFTVVVFLQVSPSNMFFFIFGYVYLYSCSGILTTPEVILYAIRSNRILCLDHPDNHIDMKVTAFNSVYLVIFHAYSCLLVYWVVFCFWWVFVSLFFFFFFFFFFFWGGGGQNYLFFEKVFLEYMYQYIVKQFGSRSGPTCCRA